MSGKVQVSLRCHCHGSANVTAPGKRARKRKIVKCGCEAHINYSYRAIPNRWFINKCVLTHCHELLDVQRPTILHINEIPPDVLERIRCLVVARASKTIIRETIRIANPLLNIGDDLLRTLIGKYRARGIPSADCQRLCDWLVNQQVFPCILLLLAY
jgi:hypothetical protein